MEKKKKRWSKLTVTVDIETRQEIENLAHQNGRKVGSMVKELLMQWLDGKGGDMKRDAQSARLLALELWIKRLFFLWSGGDQRRCREEQQRIEEIVNSTNDSALK